MIKQICKSVLSTLLLLALIPGCTKQEAINNEYIFQIKNVGLRQGVFLRRYKVSADYGSSKNITSDKLKKFINETLLSDYLLIQDAYDLGLNEDSTFQIKNKDYQISLLAGNHPSQLESLTILKDDLHDFYSKKSFIYDIDMVQTKSYSSANSIFNLLRAGDESILKKKEPNLGFPQVFHLQNLSYGEKLHPELYSVLEQMKEGEVSEPVYAGFIWIIIKLNKKQENKKLKSFDEMKSILLQQAQVIYKYKQQKEVVSSLKEKYNVSIQETLVPSLINAYRLIGNHGRIDKNQIDNSTLNKILFQVKDEKFSLSSFISTFNRNSQFQSSPALAEQDVNQFINNFLAQYVLYLDVIDRKIELNELVKDQMENKEHRMLLSDYLKKEIVHKSVFSDEDAKNYYNQNKDRWKADYEKVASNVKNDLKKDFMMKKKKDILEKLKVKYHVRYNENLLTEIAKVLNTNKSNSQ